MTMKEKSPLRLWYIVLHFLLVTVSGQPVGSTVSPDSNKSLAAIIGIVAVMFLISCLLSLYARKCGDRQSHIRHRIDLVIPTGGSSSRSQGEPCGLTQELIDTFPTFLYSDVKDLKIGNTNLACAVCLNEFEQEDALRMIPKCSHVYHVTCISHWLASKTTCPLCRANLVEDANMPPTFSIPIQDDHESHQNHEHEHCRTYIHGPESVGERETIIEVAEENQKQNSNMDFLSRINQSHPTRSKSTGFLSSLVFQHSNSTSHFIIQPGDNCERFTLRLPDEVRNQMLMNSKMKRANSCTNFTRMSSGTWGYRTRSVGCGLGRGFVQIESEEQWGFTSLTPPKLNKSNSWNKLTRKFPVQCSGVDLDRNNVGEQSSNLFSLG